jgi:hypothetical protein
VVDASSSGVAIAAQVLNGSTAAATGTVIWGGCQVEAGAYATSMQPTVAAAQTRNAEVATVTTVDLNSNTFCAAATIDPLWTSATFEPSATAVEPSWGGGIFTMLQASSGSSAPRTLASANIGTTAVSGRQRLVGYDDGVNVYISNGTNSSTTAAGAPSDRLRTAVGIGSGVNPQLMGIVSLVQVDPSPTRCR